MRRCLLWLTFLVCLTTLLSACAATGKVIKVLPQLLDSKGRNEIAPSLYERDAYQAYLRQHTNQVFGMQFAIQWKAKGPATRQLTLRVEARGIARGNLPSAMTIERPVEPTGLISPWTMLYVGYEDYKALGELTAWRVTLWEGDQQLSQQKSFLW